MPTQKMESNHAFTRIRYKTLAFVRITAHTDVYMVTARTIPIRLEEDLIERLDALAQELTERAAGAKVSRTAAMRVALERGLEVIESDMGLAGRRRKPKK